MQLLAASSLDGFLGPLVQHERTVTWHDSHHLQRGQAWSWLGLNGATATESPLSPAWWHHSKRAPTAACMAIQLHWCTTSKLSIQTRIATMQASPAFHTCSQVPSEARSRRRPASVTPAGTGVMLTMNPWNLLE